MSSLIPQGVVYDIALSFVPGVGCNLSKQLISYCGSAEKVFQTPKGKLLKTYCPEKCVLVVKRVSHN